MEEDREYIEWCRSYLQRIVNGAGYYEGARIAARSLSEMTINLVDEMDESIIPGLILNSPGCSKEDYEDTMEKINKIRSYKRRFEGVPWMRPLPILPEIPEELSDGKGGWKWPEPTSDYFKFKKQREDNDISYTRGEGNAKDDSQGCVSTGD